MSTGQMQPTQMGYPDPGAVFPALRPVLDELNQANGRTIDLDRLGNMLRSLKLTRADVEPAVHFSDECYQRNMIKLTDWYELVVLCWKSGQRTPIHDHKGSGCAFVVIDGVATESKFERTDSGFINPLWTKYRDPGYVCASTEWDIHQVGNTGGPGTEVINLHLYSPPIRNYNVYSQDCRNASSEKNCVHNTCWVE